MVSSPPKTDKAVSCATQAVASKVVLHQLRPLEETSHPTYNGPWVVPISPAVLELGCSQGTQQDLSTR